MPKDDGFHFDGFRSPNGTIVPDDVFDVLAPELTEAELRVLLYIVRRTFGFKKSRDQISLTQMVDGIKTRDGRTLDRGTGMSRRGVMKGCAGLVEKGVITVEKRRSELGDSDVNTYSLRFRERDDPEVGNKVPYPRERSAPPVGNQVPPQHDSSGDEPASTDRTDRQRTGRHNSNLRRQPVRDGPLDTGPSIDVNGYSERPIPSRQPSSSGDQVSQELAASQDGAVNSSAAAAAIPARRPLRARLAPDERRRYDQDRRRVVDYLSDFARELGDAAPLASSVTRAVNIQRAAGVDFDAFAEALYHARAVTKEHWAAIREETKKPGASWSTKRAMPYFFAELERVLGLRDLPETPAEHAARKAAEAAERERARQRAGRGDARAGAPRAWVQTYEPRRRRSGSDGA